MEPAPKAQPQLLYGRPTSSENIFERLNHRVQSVPSAGRKLSSVQSVGQQASPAGRTAVLDRKIGYIVDMVASRIGGAADSGGSKMPKDDLATERAGVRHAALAKLAHKFYPPKSKVRSDIVRKVKQWRLRRFPTARRKHFGDRLIRHAEENCVGGLRARAASSSPEVNPVENDSFYRELLVHRYSELLISTKPTHDEEIDVCSLESDAETKAGDGTMVDSLKSVTIGGWTEEGRRLAGRIKQMLTTEQTPTRASRSESGRFLAGQTSADNETAAVFDESDSDSGFDESWIDSSSSTAEECQLLNRIVSVLRNVRLCLASCEGSRLEPIVNLNAFTRFMTPFRTALTPIVLNRSLGPWLHYTLIRHLDEDMLYIYLELLRFLWSRVRNLADVILASYDQGQPEMQRLIVEFVRKTKIKDPMLEADIGKELTASGAYHFLFVSPFPKFLGLQPAGQLDSRRYRRIKSLLQPTGQRTVADEARFEGSAVGMTFDALSEEMTSLVRRKVAEAKKVRKSEQIVLVGWETGGYYALKVVTFLNGQDNNFSSSNMQIAAEYPNDVAACICFSFPVGTLSGSRASYHDEIIRVRQPVMFVAGQFSNLSQFNELQDLRDIMSGETGLVVVGGANDELVVSSQHLMTHKVTQGAVDLAIVDYVGEFLHGTLTAKPKLDSSATPAVDEAAAQKAAQSVVESIGPAALQQQQRQSSGGREQSETAGSPPPPQVAKRTPPSTSPSCSSPSTSRPASRAPSVPPPLKPPTKLPLPALSFEEALKVQERTARVLSSSRGMGAAATLSGAAKVQRQQMSRASLPQRYPVPGYSGTLFARPAHRPYDEPRLSAAARRSSLQLEQQRTLGRVRPPTAFESYRPKQHQELFFKRQKEQQIRRHQQQVPPRFLAPPPPPLTSAATTESSPASRLQLQLLPAAETTKTTNATMMNTSQSTLGVAERREQQHRLSSQVEQEKEEPTSIII